MSMATLERAILARAKIVFKNQKLRLKDILEWSTSEDQVKKNLGAGEVYAHVKDLGAYITIAKEHDYSFLAGKEQHVMACHETHDAHCIGWLAHQCGPGNNIAMRMRMMSCENADQVKLIGDQHETFEDTLPS